MTLIIGLCCSDGIVLGADDAAIFGNDRTSTIRAAFKKIRIVDGVSALSVAGTSGLLQQYEDAVMGTHKNDAFLNSRPVEAMNMLRDEFMARTNAQFRVAQMLERELGQRAWDSSSAEIVVATRTGGKYRLYHYDKRMSPEEITNELPFVAIGSGQQTADPFIAHLRRIYYAKQCPDIALGVMTVVWTLKHAAETGATNVGSGRQIVTLSSDGDVAIISELPDEQLQEHYEFIDRAEETMRSLARPTWREASPPLPALPETG
jgi:20S proteasome alpha/beta subunit